MAMTEDMDFPRLTPQGDRLPSGNRLFRKAGELTDEQFDQLAAAWADDALRGDALTELEEVMSVIPGRRDRAESFHRLHLTPVNESWPGMRSCLRPSPIRVAFRRTILPALMAAAAMMALIIMGPAATKLKIFLNPGTTPGPVALTTAEIPASHPIVAVNRNEEKRGSIIASTGKTASVRGNASVKRNASDQGLLTTAKTARTLPLALAHGYAGLPAIAPVRTSEIAPVTTREILPGIILQEDKNWMLRSISFLASAVSGKEKEINGYMIANGCITGINSILGWEMELEQVSNSRGNPVAVSFSSSLLSFTKPLNKTSP